MKQADILDDIFSRKAMPRIGWNQFSIPTYGFLRLPQILKIFPISKSAWWEGCRTGRFPKPVKLGPRTTVWKAEEIAALVNRLNGQEGNHER